MKSRLTNLLLIFTAFILLSPDCEHNRETADKDPRDFITGEWNCHEYLDGKFQMTYIVTIIKDVTDESHIILQNFAFIDDEERPPYAVLEGGSLVVPTQQVCYDQSITVYGTGQYISKNETHWEYTMEVGGDSFTYTAVFERIH